MAESPTLNRAAKILTDLQPGEPADAGLRRHLADAKHLSSSERRSVSRSVFAFFRWLKWLDENESLQVRLLQAIELQNRFDQDPDSFKDETMAARVVPAWLKDEMEIPAEYLHQLQQEPALWIRARPGKGLALSKALGSCEPPAGNAGPAVGTAYRFKGSADLFVTPQFHAGEFEIQDLASQLVGHACGVSKKQTWWDACAGEGGKTLHLGDLMENTGLIWASDRSERRLATLKRRAGRAKLFNYRTARWDGTEKLPTKTKFDGILIDAPCSGVGTWQRNPHARWSTTIDDVKELAIVQQSLLNFAAGSVKPGGKLVFSVCTLTRSETSAIADAFEAAHPEFTPHVMTLGPTESARITLWPQDYNANGMFIAAWQRSK